MKRQWILTIAAAAAVGLVAPAAAEAQGASTSARGQQSRGQQAQEAQQERARQARAQQEARRQQDARGQQDRAQQARRAQEARAQQARRAEQARAAEQRRRDADRYERRDDRYQDRRYYDLRSDNGPPFCRNGSGHPVHGRQWCRDKGWGLGVQWERQRWDDVILRQPRTRDPRLDRGGLIDVLGDVVLRRFEGQGRRHGGGAITGNWLNEADGGVLQLVMGGVPFARLVDTNRDGRIDTVLMRR